MQTGAGLVAGSRPPLEGTSKQSSTPKIRCYDAPRELQADTSGHAGAAPKSGDPASSA